MILSNFKNNFFILMNSNKAISETTNDCLSLKLNTSLSKLESSWYISYII